MSYLQKIVFALPFYGKTFLISFSLLIIVFALFNFQSAQASLVLSRLYCFYTASRVFTSSEPLRFLFSFACSVASFLFLHSLPRLYKPQTFNGLLSASLASASCKPQRFFSLLPYEKSLVGLSGLEPPTSRLSGVRSNRLSYKPFSDSQLLRFPLIPTVVEMRRIELLTPCLQGRCSPS